MTLVGGSVWGFYELVPERWVVWAVGVTIGLFLLPVVATLVNHGLGQPEWPPRRSWPGEED